MSRGPVLACDKLRERKRDRRARERTRSGGSASPLRAVVLVLAALAVPLVVLAVPLHLTGQVPVEKGPQGGPRRHYRT